MSGFDAVRRRRLRTRRIAVAGALAVVAGVFVTTISSPPSSQQPTDVQGRTWVPVVTEEGPQLVLVNGISGLIEARATTTEPQPEGVQVVASTIDRTVLGSSDALTVVDNGHHAAVSQTGISGATATLVGDLVLTLGDGQVELRDADLDGEPTEIAVPATIVAEVAPVVDDDGTAWFLGDDGGDLRAFGLAQGPGADLESRNVADSTTALIVIDGDAHATGPDGTASITGDASKPVVSSSPTVPSVAVDTDGLWAAADRRDLTVIGDDEAQVRLDDEVTDLAIWNGSVVAATEGGAAVVSESGEVEAIDALDDQVTFHTAGGLLWLTSRNTVVAIWPDQTQVPFELAAVDVDLCIGTCTPEDFSRFLDERPDDPAPDRSSTTQPPRQLEPPSVDPTVPTTTAPPTTTTTPDRPSGSDGPGRSTTTSIPSSSTTEVAGSPGTGSSTTEAEGPSDRPSDPDPDPEPDPTPPGNGPGRPDPPGQPPTPPPPSTPEPPPETTTTSTIPPPGEVHLILELDTSPTSTRVTLGLLGSRRDCPGARGGSVDASLRWEGVAEGSREVRVPWRGGGDSQVVDFDIGHTGGGTLTVTMQACGLSATRTATISGDQPEISGISLNPTTPRPGEAFIARVGWEMPEGWAVTSTAWSGGICGATAPVGDNSPRQEQAFTAESGRFCVSVIVTLAPPDGGSRNEERATEFDVAATTTAPPATTTTTEPPAITTTTAPPASTTTEPPAATTSTVPPEPPPP